jgi:hypothetical protein
MSNSEQRIDVGAILESLPEELFDSGEDRWGGASLIYCRSGCPTPGAHSSWGECARASNFHTLVGQAVDDNRKLERNLQAYRDVRRQGLQPQSIRRPFVEATKKAAGA